MVATTRTSTTTAAYRSVAPGMRNRGFSFSRAKFRTNSTKNGNDMQTPTRGKYNRCSKITSIMETTLDVGARVIKNQKMENANTGACRRRRHPSTAMVERNTNEAITAGSNGLAEGGK